MKIYEENNEILDVVKKIKKYACWIEEAICKGELSMKDDDEEEDYRKYRGSRYSRF